ncbi:murein L,D-transpeptidase [Terrihabitans soli]|uniref:Murein L,D-transpeptidase n=1 Tax=Terrihabitans soli TaxID=708113 RepID=A0A6S6QR72_9HYPH|nr:L,D-transpeptidase [Terrihabitans soli]BCJ91549.1 murein L,D-transpeptidase [Terrihabitans soli]
MRLFGVWFVLFVLMLSLPALAGDELAMDNVNGARLGDEAGPAVVLKTQILLDRSRYSPGVIDGVSGDATGIAIKAFQIDNGLKPTGTIDEEGFAKLTTAHPEPVLVRYTIEPEDVGGPFAEKIPDSISEMAKLKRLAFTSPRELLSERFHMSEDLLSQLNPEADFSKTGTEIVVAAVHQTEGRSAAKDKIRAERLIVDKSERSLRVLGRDEDLIAFYPATIGSDETPAPDGEAVITRIARGPTWNYDPKLELYGHKDRPDQKMTIKAGPNNPVGTVWIAINRNHYGIHGTAEPEKIGKNVSSGCVRLTNWDVEELAGFVRKGVKVVFQE